MVTDLGSKNLQELFPHIRSEESVMLVADRSGFRDLELAHVVHIDQSVVGEGEVE